MMTRLDRLLEAYMQLEEVTPEWLGSKIGKYARKALSKGELGRVSRASDVLDKAKTHAKNMHLKRMENWGWDPRGLNKKISAWEPRRVERAANLELLKDRKPWVSPLTGKSYKTTVRV